MNLRQYIAFFSFGTLVAWAAWAVVLVNIDPVSSGIPALIIFYITLFAALMGSFTTTGTIIRAYRFKKRDLEDIIITSLRQSLMLSVLIETSLILLSVEHLNLLTVGGVVLVIAIIEFIALSRKHGKRHSH